MSTSSAPSSPRRSQMLGGESQRDEKSGKSSAPPRLSSNVDPDEQHTSSDDEQRGFMATLLDGFRDYCRWLSNSSRFTAFTTLLTLFVLFGDDIRLLSTQKPSDAAFDVLTIMSLTFFAIELLANVVAKDDYMLSFFMVLDTIATVTLIFDVSSVAEGLAASDNEEGGAVDGSMARASRASRAGTRAARVVRIIRLIRLVRIAKLYSASLDRMKGDQMTTALIDEDDDDENGGRGREESRVGKKLSEKTTKKVIIIVLGMMGVGPLFAFETLHDSDPQSKQIGSEVFMNDYVQWRLLHDVPNPTATHTLQVELARKQFEDSLLFYVYVHNPLITSDMCIGGVCAADYTNRLIWIGALRDVADELPVTHLPPSTWDDRFFPQGDSRWVYSLGTLPQSVRTALSTRYSIECSFLQTSVWGVSLRLEDEYPIRCPSDLRFMERLLVVAGHNIGDKAYIVVVYFDLRESSKFSAALNILTTLFICGILWWGAMAFSKVTDTLVLIPLERMIERVERIKMNPYEALYSSDEKEKPVVSIELHPSWWKLTAVYRWYDNVRKKKAAIKSLPMETVVLEKTIIKIGGLMALGFGEAGMEIISQNMQGGSSSSINAMIPGKRINGIFSYCDVRNFTDTTEILQDQIMVFVNTISGIIHPIVDEYLGAPNKNIGDSFLLVWRFKPWYNEQMVQKIADLALLAFVRVVAELNINPDLRSYRTHEQLLQRMPNYSVRIGFGVHVGWAIEGAIGSEFKIDASYLSPNVNMATKLEALTKDYGVIILATNSFVRLLSSSMRHVCRAIDHVQVTGYKASVSIYAVDLDTAALADRSPGGLGRRVSFCFDVKQYRKAPVHRASRAEEKAKKLESSYVPYETFLDDNDIRAMRRKFTEAPDFVEKFNMGLLNYESGEWQVARTFFEFTAKHFTTGPADGPSVTLLTFLRLHDYVAPKGWPGYRHME